MNQKNELKYKSMFVKKLNSDICDYIDWRGDLNFELSPLNDVDALIFAQLSYINFTGLAPDGFNSSIKLSELAKIFFGSSDFEKRSNLGMLIDPKSNELLKRPVRASGSGMSRLWALSAVMILQRKSSLRR